MAVAIEMTELAAPWVFIALGRKIDYNCWLTVRSFLASLNYI